MMTDRSKDTAAKMAVAQALLGKTTGASKGYMPPPDAKVKVRPVGGIKNITQGPQGAKVTWEKKW